MKATTAPALDGTLALRYAHGVDVTLLSLPVYDAVRLIVLQLLDECGRAVPRLHDAKDTEALHDLRVGLRRLRSCVRAYGPFLHGAIRRKLRDELKELAGATGAERDSEVALEWLRALPRTALRPRERVALTWLVERLEQRRGDAHHELEGGIAARFDGLRARFDKAFTRAAGIAEPFAPITADLVIEHAAELDAHLAKVRSPNDEDEAHEARIAAKRLRYLIEPLKDEVAAVAPVIKHMKSLQELLGQLHDTVVLAGEIPRLLWDGPRPAGGADPRPGLVAITVLLTARRDALHAELDAGWLDGRAGPLIAELGALATAVREGGVRGP